MHASARARCIVAAALIVAASGCRERSAAPDARGSTESSEVAPSRILYPSAPGSFVDLVRNAKRSVVAIHAKSPMKSGPAAMFPGTPDSTADVALGTGFLVESHGVYVLTNDHIVAASPDLLVILEGGVEAPAKIVGRDPRLDLALLAIDVPRLAPLPLGDSDQLNVGEWLVVLGNPFGDEVSATVGIVSATGRDAAGSLVPGRAMGFRTFLQTDARIHRGNSGGPVLDTSGQVVGVAVATGDRLGEIAFAIPANRVRETIEALREYGQVSRGWLGVLVKPVTPELATTLGLPKPAGAYVTEVKAGSPAARAGLRVGDIVIKWAERDVTHQTLPWIVAAQPINKPVAVTVWRNRAELPIPVVTEKMPE